MVTFKNIRPYMEKKKKKKLKLYTQLKHLKHNVHSFWYTGFISSYWRDNVIQMWRQTDTLKHFSNDSEARQVFGWQIQFRKHVETKCRATLQCLTQFLNAVWAKWIIKKPIHPLSSLKKGKKKSKVSRKSFFWFLKCCSVHQPFLMWCFKVCINMLMEADSLVLNFPFFFFFFFFFRIFFFVFCPKNK